MNKILYCKEIAQKIKDELKEEVLKIESSERPTLAVVRVDTNNELDDFANKKYIGNKEASCKYTGINSVLIEKEFNTTEEQLIRVIKKLNKDKSIHGIMVQEPLPKHIDAKKISEIIDQDKDVDGFGPSNTWLTVLGKECNNPCTPAGIMKIFEYYNIELKGKNIVIVGRSNIVGKPLSSLLINAGATVTVCNSNTRALKKITKSADIVVTAIGSPKYFTNKYFKDGQVIIDVGINFDSNNKMCGDVHFEKVTKNLKNISITPVPGGVGQMTVAMLLSNTFRSYKKQVKAHEDRKKTK